MLFPQLIIFGDVALLLLRLVVAIVFLSSGWSHVRNSEARGRSMGIGTIPAAMLGGAELVAGLMLGLGIFAQIGALILAGVMLGAIFFKVFIWNTSFYAKKGYGWHYDLLLLAANLVVLTIGPGMYVLLP